MIFHLLTQLHYVWTSHRSQSPLREYTDDIQFDHASAFLFFSFSRGRKREEAGNKACEWLFAREKLDAGKPPIIGQSLILEKI